MNFKVSILAMVVGAMGVLSTGCGDPCGDLNEQCGNCEGAVGIACDVVVNADDSDACEAARDSGSYTCS